MDDPGAPGDMDALWLVVVTAMAGSKRRRAATRSTEWQVGAARGAAVGLFLAVAWTCLPAARCYTAHSVSPAAPAPFLAPAPTHTSADSSWRPLPPQPAPRRCCFAGAGMQQTRTMSDHPPVRLSVPT